MTDTQQSNQEPGRSFTADNDVDETETINTDPQSAPVPKDAPVGPAIPEMPPLHNIKDMFSVHTLNFEKKSIAPASYKLQVKDYLKVFQSNPCLSSDGVIMLDQLLISMVIANISHKKHDINFQVHAPHKEIGDLIDFINQNPITIWDPIFPQNFSKRKWSSQYYSLITSAASGLTGTLAQSDFIFSQKYKDQDFVENIILPTIIANINTLSKSIKLFREWALPKEIFADIKKEIINLPLNKVWPLDDRLKLIISKCFRPSPLKRGGYRSKFRGRFNRFKSFRFGQHQHNYLSRGSRGNRSRGRGRGSNNTQRQQSTENQL